MPRLNLFLLGCALMLLTALGGVPVTAQNQNLLVNPGFEQGGEFGPYTASLGDPEFNFGQGWSGWLTQTPKLYEWQNTRITAFPHNGSFKVQGNNSQSMGRSGGTWTASAFQTVSNIANGTKLQATAKVYMENGAGTNARVRIGIGSNVGSDPTSPAIVWSAYMTSVNSWQQVSIETIVPVGSVTVFIYGTQDTPNGPTGPNTLYIDDSGLFVTGAGTPSAPTGADGQVNVPPPATSTPAPIYAPFVSAQANIENGKIVHTVQSGDTIAAISVAYGVPISTIQKENNLTGGLIFAGQKIIIKDAPLATTAPTATPVLATLTTAPVQTQSSTQSAGGFVQPTRAGTSAPQATAIVGNATVIAALASTTPLPLAAAATSTPTDLPPTNMPASTDTATIPPTLSAPTLNPQNTPVNPADAATAPVSQGQTADPLATTATVCVLMFDDANQNRIQNSTEALLAGGTITLRQGTQDVASTQTNGTDEPYCFEDLAPGSYTALAVAPDGYGMTTPASLVVSVQAGTGFRLVFGAAQGVAVAVAPTPNNQESAPALNEVAIAPAGTLELGSIAGILVIGGALLALIGGIVVYFIARRL